MAYLVRVEPVMSGTEVQRIMRELSGWFSVAAEGEGWEVTVEGVDEYAPAREAVVGRLAQSSETWSIHVCIVGPMPPLTPEEYEVVKDLPEAIEAIFDEGGVPIDQLSDAEIREETKDMIALMRAAREGYEATHPDEPPEDRREP